MEYNKIYMLQASDSSNPMNPSPHTEITNMISSQSAWMGTTHHTDRGLSVSRNRFALGPGGRKPELKGRMCGFW